MLTSKAQKLRYPKPLDKWKAKDVDPNAPKRQTSQPPANKRHPPPPLKGGLGNGKPLIETTPNSKKSGIFKQLTLDTETTGVDLWHGCKPFFVSTCDEDGNLRFWEWEVDPTNREVQVPTKDLKELEKLIQENHFILHNTKFDVRALEALGLPRINLSTVQDTLIASHVLVSNESHKLKDLALQYLNIDDDDQQDLRDATNEARSYGRSMGWDIARDGGHPHFPAQRHAPKDGWWVYDTWLPRAVAYYLWFTEENEEWAPRDAKGRAITSPTELSSLDPDFSNPWWTVLRTYALRDVERTYGLWWLQLDGMEHEGLMPQYEERRRLLESIYEMESHGATVSKRALTTLQKKLELEIGNFKTRCYEIADYKIDNLNSSRQLEGLLFGNFGIRPGKMTRAGMEGKEGGQTYSTGNDVLLKLLDRTEGEHREFIWKLLAYRAREKSCDYLEEYDLRGMPSSPGWFTLHSSFNPTGTDTVRFSSSGPNLQNVGKGGKRKDDPIPSLRSIFGPRPGREWYSIDYSNIEMRIFAFKSGDPQLIEAFNTGYSVHLIFAELLYEEEWADVRVQVLKDNASDQDFKPYVRRGKGVASIIQIMKGNAQVWEKLRRMTGEKFKVLFEATYYQWVKNGNFALIYGAGEDKADTTYHRPGAYRLIRKMLPKIDQFMKAKDHEAKTYGYITTEGGYRLFVPPSEPHVAVNYYVQGTAGWCMVLAINRVHSFLKLLNERIRREGKGSGEGTYRMIMTIHDELDFDFPLHPRNEQVIKEIGRIMTSSGDSVGVPTPVEIERHAKNWAEGSKVK